MNMQNIILLSADARKCADAQRPPLPDFAKPGSEVGNAVLGPKRKAPYFDPRHISRNPSHPADDMDVLTPAGQFAGYFPYEGFHSPETTSCGQVIHGDFHKFISLENHSRRLESGRRLDKPLPPKSAAHKNYLHTFGLNTDYRAVPF